MQLSTWLFPVGRCQQRFRKLVQTFGPQHGASCWDTVPLVLADRVMLVLEESVEGYVFDPVQCVRSSLRIIR